MGLMPMDNQPVNEPLAALEAALEKDRALGLGAVLRYFRLERRDLESAGVLVRDLRIGLQHRDPLETYAVAVCDESAGLSSQQLRHLCGTGATRLVLGASLESWENLADRVGDASKPDALWHSPKGLVGIEFDTSSYNPEQVSTKLERFKRYLGGQVWTTSRPRRLEELRRRMVGVSDATALLVNWFLPVKGF
jgi:hypothetical protein